MVDSIRKEPLSFVRKGGIFGAFLECFGEKEELRHHE